MPETDHMQRTDTIQRLEHVPNESTFKQHTAFPIQINTEGCRISTVFSIVSVWLRTRFADVPTLC